MRWRGVGSALLVGLVLVSTPLPAAESMLLGGPSHCPSLSLVPAGSLEPVWTFRCGGILGGPVLCDDVVYVGSRDGYLYAVSAQTGQRLWRASICAPGNRGPGAMHSTYGYQEDGVLGAPAVDAERVYVGGVSGEFHARRRDTGRTLWVRSWPGAITSSPLLIGDQVVVGHRGGEIVAMRRATGEVAWRYATGGPVNSSPAATDGLIVCGTSSGLVALHAADGTLAWRYDSTEAPRTVADPASDRHVPVSNDNAHAGRRFDASPVVADGVVYAAGWSGLVLALDLADGKLRWSRQVTTQPIHASPAVAADSLYISVTNGVVLRLDRATGLPDWHLALVDKGTWRSRPASLHTTPVVCGEVLLVPASGARLRVIDRDDGEVVASIGGGFQDYVRDVCAAPGEGLLVASEDGAAEGRIVRLSAAGGQEWPADAVVTSPLLGKLACRELGYLPRAAEPGWRQAATIDGFACIRILGDHGLLSPARWSSAGPVNRNQFASFLYKLQSRPNPLAFVMRPHEAVALGDATELAWEVREVVPWVVGLGIVRPVNGAYRGYEPLTVGVAKAAFARLRELGRP